MALRTINMCFASLDFIENLFSQWLHLDFREGQGISVAGNQVPLEAVTPPKGFFTSPTGEGW